MRPQIKALSTGTVWPQFLAKGARDWWSSRSLQGSGAVWQVGSPGCAHLDEVVSDVLGFETVHSLGCRLCHVHPGVIWLQLAEVSKEVSCVFKERCRMARKHLQTKHDPQKFSYVSSPRQMQFMPSNFTHQTEASGQSNTIHSCILYHHIRVQKGDPCHQSRAQKFYPQFPLALLTCVTSDKLLCLTTCKVKMTKLFPPTL